jgi:DNA-binding transcriptional ArsR family regulator
MHTLSTRPDLTGESKSEPRTIQFGTDGFDDVLDALGSDTARTILRSVQTEPLTASEIAERADTSIQNASYHLRTLTDVGLIRVVDTVYSEKGCEMNLYYAVDTALLLETAQPEAYGDE